MNQLRHRRLSSSGLVCLFGLLCGGTVLLAHEGDSAADVLARARKSQESGDHSTAVKQFREFLTRFRHHADAPAARFGLGVSLIEGPEHDYQAALEPLQTLAADKESPKYPAVLLYLGLAHRGVGLRNLASDDAKRRTAAKPRFEDAAGQFAAAADAFAARVKKLPAPNADLPADLEAAATARCHRAEMLLRIGKVEDARSDLAAFLKDSTLRRSRSRDLALYYHSLASFLVQDYTAAGRSLSQLDTFEDADFSGHAHYLRACVHHILDERAEAASQYEATIADYNVRRAKAVELLGQPEKMPLDRITRERVEALAKRPPPEYVGRAVFALGLLTYEAGRFSDARARFADFVKQHPGSPLHDEARLLQGICAVQLEQFAEALPPLQRLAGNDSALTGLALLWLAKAQAGSADAEDVDAQAHALKQALDTVRRAADKFRPAAGADAETVRTVNRQRGQVLLIAAELHHRAGQHGEAAAILASLRNDALLPDRGEEILQRQLSALNLAGDYATSEKLVALFRELHPRSLLLPEITFRQGENAYFLSLAANQAAERTRLAREAARVYQLVADKYPESSQADVARYALAWIHYRAGEWAKARTALDTIPVPERTGELALTPYLIADCLLRVAPTTADDALSGGRVQEQLGGAAELFTAFVAEYPDDPHAADALLRLSMCQRGLAGLLAAGEERNKVLNHARTTCERVLVEYPLNELQPYAALERARCAGASGDAGEVIARLRPFGRGPLSQHPVAPLALLDLATCLRGQDNQAPAAERVLAMCRQRHEKALLKDPVRTGWVPLLQFHHAVALKEANRFAEARALFASLMKQYPERPEAMEASLRWGQALIDEAWDKMEKANQVLGTPDVKPADADAARRRIAEGWQGVREAATHWERRADHLKEKMPASECRLRMIYEAAWAERALGEQEVEAARNKLREERREVLQKEAAKTTPEGQPVPNAEAPEVPLTEVPWQPAEKKARSLYEGILHEFADAPLSADCCLELAEMHLVRDDHAAAMKLLNAAIDKEPPADVLDKVRLRLGSCLAARGNLKAALAQFQTIAATPEGTQVAQGHLRAAECLIRLGDRAAATKHLVLFRDQEPLQNVGGVSDRALLRLGHAFAQLERWEESRQAHEALVGRFGDSGWVPEARYGIGWSYHKQKEYGKAIEAYKQARGDATTETAARAQVEIGVCQLLRKQYAEAAASLKQVPAKYDCPELSAFALVEAAHVLRLLKQEAEAGKLLKQVLADYPKSEWAEVAKTRLKPASVPAPHTLAAAMRLLGPDVAEFPSLDRLGEQRSNRASLDSPSEGAMRALILARQPRTRLAPAPLVRQTLPDPFEYRLVLPVPVPLRDEQLPFSEALRLAGR